MAGLGRVNELPLFKLLFALRVLLHSDAILQVGCVTTATAVAVAAAATAVCECVEAIIMD